ncbi:protein of unknown function [Microbacterium sp. Nx66]|nr:protein of unknown function [Microbacterium sp. Nx66]
MQPFEASKRVSNALVMVRREVDIDKSGLESRTQFAGYRPPLRFGLDAG